ncbi:hypothetical protein [Streptomyces caelestis]|jgi:hypothetical protein|uniref:Uncharacterized protein n=1 Tax=Streptomyces caelestis TaxID=36816 RepID=A0A7W9H0S7_9ACTN|nr:hypothetical protein [Streptomyces caelestis]MBB5793545.1 hypothetical protein [Streptomyces caelestis]GGW57024.1 hypothetical protein GCM10010320_42410 [Streptomyces caelestis]
MTRRTKKAIVTVSVLAAAGLAGGGVALAADGDETPREQVRFVVEEGTSSGGGAAGDQDCPWKDGGTAPSGTAPNGGDPAPEL